MPYIPDALQEKIDIVLINTAKERGWVITPTCFYDEDGVEGYRYTSPEGKEYIELFNHDEPPPLINEIVDWLYKDIKDE